MIADESQYIYHKYSNQQPCSYPACSLDCFYMVEGPTKAGLYFWVYLFSNALFLVVFDLLPRYVYPMLIEEYLSRRVSSRVRQNF